MAVSTTQSIWRSGGGDQSRTAYCGTGLMIAQFYIPNLASAATTKVQLSSTNTNPVILPVNAVVTRIEVAAISATGGTSPTFDMGFTGVTTGTATSSGLAVNAADSTQTVNLNSSAKGADLAAVMSSSEMVYITGGVGNSAPSSGTASGWIEYFVVDPLAGQQNV